MVQTVSGLVLQLEQNAVWVVSSASALAFRRDPSHTSHEF